MTYDSGWLGCVRGLTLSRTVGLGIDESWVYGRPYMAFYRRAGG